MTTSRVKRSEFATFLNKTPSAAATYCLVAKGVSSAKVNMNPKTEEQTDIDQDTASTALVSYAPTIPIQAIAYKGDDAFEFVDNLRRARAVLGDAETDIVNVMLYETPTGGEYPAEKQAVSIQIDDFGGDGGKPAEINYTINYLGNAVQGTFNPSTKTFTPAP